MSHRSFERSEDGDIHFTFKCAWGETAGYFSYRDELPALLFTLGFDLQSPPSRRVEAIQHGVIVHQLNFLLIGPRAAAGPAERALHSIMHHRTLLNLGGIVCAIGGVGLLFFKQVASLGYWGLWLTIMLCLWGSLLGVAGVMVRVIWAVGEKTQALVKDEYAMPCNPVNNGNGSRHAEAKQAGNNGAPAVSAH